MDGNGALHLRQEFEIPEGCIPVRMQVGDAPVTIVGWVSDPDNLPELLCNLVDELRAIVSERAATSAD
jgi:hypothetical protein